MPGAMEDIMNLTDSDVIPAFSQFRYGFLLL
jgi:hypothetical protein